MMKTRKTAPAASSVLLLTKEVLLALDVTQALDAVGIPTVSRAAPHLRYGAVVVDDEALTNRRAAIVSRLCHEGVPILVICDSPSKAKFIGGENAIWFQKPLSSEDLAACVAEVIGDSRNASNAEVNHSDVPTAGPSA
ncbi:hypothetical protein [Tabrizicola sp. BL-A-41-H6]|uniref:hypothetical protein n=1 Tax=Tabrizicola sp. BL-A-41-H6 TaxID=3421107 RepID=UPI003D66B221